MLKLKLALFLALVAVIAVTAFSAFGGSVKSSQGKKPPHWFKPTTGQVAQGKKPPHWF